MNKTQSSKSVVMTVRGQKYRVYLETLREDGSYSARLYTNGTTVRGVVRKGKNRNTFTPVGTNAIYV